MTKELAQKLCKRVYEVYNIDISELHVKKNKDGKDAPRMMLVYIMHIDYGVSFREIVQLLDLKREGTIISYWVANFSKKLGFDNYTENKYERVKQHMGLNGSKLKECNVISVYVKTNLHDIVRSIVRKFPDVLIEIN